MPRLNSKSHRSGHRPMIKRGAAHGNDNNDETMVGRQVKVDPSSGCWLWQGPLSGEYGQTHTGESAHRFVYRTLVDEIPDGYHLHHECEVKTCVNPKHLTPLTPSDHQVIHANRRRHAA